MGRKKKLMQTNPLTNSQIDETVGASVTTRGYAPASDRRIFDAEWGFLVLGLLSPSVSAWRRAGVASLWTTDNARALFFMCHSLKLTRRITSCKTKR